jgi:glycosyltransferase involved in cell wall biosynthesis
MPPACYERGAMRICLVNLDYAPQRSSGLGVYGETLVNGLVAQGHEVHVVARGQAQPDGNEVRGGAVVHRVPGGWLDWITFARQAGPVARALDQQHRFHIMHFADVHLAYAYRGPFVATLHQSFRQRLRAQGHLPAHSGAPNLLSRLAYYTTARYLAERPCVRRAKQLIAVSRTTARAFADEYDLPSEHIAVVRNGIDTARFAATPSDVRTRLGLETAQVLLFVGFCTPRKGLEYLAAALRRLPEHVYLLVIGRWEERYRRRVLAALGPAARRMINLGYVPDEDLAAYYSMADLFVMPSLLEGFGLPIAEALACGTPVVTTSAGACAEVAGPGGLVVPPMDAKALAVAIASLLQQPERRRAMAQLGQVWARRNLSAEAMVQGHLEVYERMLGQAGRPGKADCHV